MLKRLLVSPLAKRVVGTYPSPIPRCPSDPSERLGSVSGDNSLPYLGILDLSSYILSPSTPELAVPGESGSETVAGLGMEGRICSVT